MAHFDECGNSEEYNLEYLPVHVLYIIFGYLDIRSLLALSSVCRTLNNIIKNDYLNAKSFSLLVTNQFSAEVRKKSLRILSGIHKYRNNFHWRKSYYSDNVFLKSVERFRPWLQLGSRDLFVSQGSKILLFKRNETGIGRKPCLVFKGHREDVVRFVVKDNIMISGGNDGKICRWDTKKGKALFSITTPVRWNEILYVDFSQSTVSSGSSLLGKVDFWSVRDNGFSFSKTIQLNERLRSLSLSEDATLCALGTCGYKASPLKVLDITRELFINLSGDFKVGAGVYDIIWETPQVFLTGGYDSMLNLWDIRLGGRARSWGDPFDAAIYSLATDYHHTIMTGSASDSRVTLWDKRHSRWVQVYFLSDSTFPGPVYSFDFDPTFMFAALDSSLHILDFSDSNRRAKI